MLASEYQSAPVQIDLLLPDLLSAGTTRLPVLYILPVTGPTGEYGDGLVEARIADLANRHRIICVRPYFSSVPWYGDHISDRTIRHESHLLKTVIPWVDTHFPTLTDAEGRWLMGFSKSGWGACTLLMRNPNVFGYAAAWDAPFMLSGDGDDWGPMGLKRHFGAREHMLASLPTHLARLHAGALRERQRLVIGVGHFWEKQCIQYHEFLKDMEIPHRYRDDFVLEHRWDTGWFAPIAVELILMARSPT